MNDGSLKRLDIDVIVPVYGERQMALKETLEACSNQSYPVSRLYVVDDGSPEPVSLPDAAAGSSQIHLFRLSHNQGISVARNAGIAQSKATFVACVNTQILPDVDWVNTCLQYLASHPKVGACYTRMVPIRPKRILTQWRMRFLETKFGSKSGPSPFAPGHAALFRREALDAVGGYDVRHRLHHEDSDICQRMWQRGWETHYVAESRCVSTQQDTLELLAKKELRESYWYSPAESSLLHLFLHLSKWTMIRAGRNVAKARLHFLPIDVSIWAYALWIATSQELKHAWHGR
jgi:cellulose synthase/poly-beta-1,6-N-acetylglucosamine synthase-like glycosyltransferase